MVAQQDVSATAKVDSNHILIGDWFKLQIDVQHPKNVNVILPTLPDTLEGFEVVKREQPIQKQTDQLAMESMIFIMTSFDSGMHIIPSIPIQYSRANDTTKYFVQTSPILIMVGGIAVDTTKDIKDIKPPLSVPITLADILPYIIAVVGIGGAIWLVRYIIQKRKRGEPLIPEEPPRPAHEVALEALRSLESEKLWQRGKVKDYHSKLTDIIRTYIERRFNISAMESTSDEILQSFANLMIDKEIKESLKEILYRADLVKFAKFLPLAEENEASMALAFKFVESTWKEQEQKTEAQLQEVKA